MRYLVWLRRAGCDPNPMRNRAAEAAEKVRVREEKEVEAVLRRVVESVVRGTVPTLRRVEEEGPRMGASRYWGPRATSMRRRDLADKLAEAGKGPVRGKLYIVDEVLNVRKAGSGLQVLVRWRGAQHEDEWIPCACCDEKVQREAVAMARVKLGERRRQKRPAPDVEVRRPTRGSARVAQVPAIKRLRDGEGRRVRPVFLSPVLPTYSPGPAGPSRAYGVGAGRSKRGLPIVWESPDVESLRGRLWEKSVAEVRMSKRKVSPLADESLAKRRKEGT